MLVPGWILVLSLSQGPAVIPVPYTTEEACMEAHRQTFPKQHSNWAICVPTEGALEGPTQEEPK